MQVTRTVQSNPEVSTDRASISRLAALAGALLLITSGHVVIEADGDLDRLRDGFLIALFAGPVGIAVLVKWLQFGTSCVSRFALRWPVALQLTMFLAVVTWGLAVFAGSITFLILDDFHLGFAAMVPVCIVVLTPALYGRFIRHPETGPVEIGQGFLILLVQLIPPILLTGLALLLVAMEP